MVPFQTILAGLAQTSGFPQSSGRCSCLGSGRQKGAETPKCKIIQMFPRVFFLELGQDAGPGKCPSRINQCQRHRDQSHQFKAQRKPQERKIRQKNALYTPDRLGFPNAPRAPLHAGGSGAGGCQKSAGSVSGAESVFWSEQHFWEQELVLEKEQFLGANRDVLGQKAPYLSLARRSPLAAPLRPARTLKNGIF